MATKDKLSALGFPIGWHVADFPQGAWEFFIFSKILGILVSTIAISLGAPFWFDLLNRLVNLRMSGENTGGKM
ncbi:MAG: hypothetical protein AAF639_41525 [Chloroflexota bacterium]